MKSINDYAEAGDLWSYLLQLLGCILFVFILTQFTSLTNALLVWICWAKVGCFVKLDIISRAFLEDRNRG